MKYTFDRFTAEVQTLLSTTKRIPASLLEVQVPKPGIPADLAFPTFRAAKELGLSPQQLAQELVQTIQITPNSLIDEVSATGPFLNFSFQAENLAEAILNDISLTGVKYGHSDDGQGKTIVVDYSSPNVAKRMHVGHIRSTIIGQTLANIFRALGYNVICDNHLGDWGKQFGVIIAAVMRDGKPQVEGEAALIQLEELYTRYSNQMTQDAALDAEARRWSLALEQGDPAARELWQWCVTTTIQANQQNYDRLTVSFDHAYGESFYEAMLTGIIQQTIEQNIAYRDEKGAVVVEIDGLPSFLLQRSDGGTLYLTRDVATIIFRLQEFQPKRILYVVGSPQELHFRQLFALVRKMGYTAAVDLVHVAFGTISDTQGQPLSTRRGNMIYLEALLNEAMARALAVVEQKNPALAAEEKAAVAEAVGVGAVIYNDLYQDPKRNITLNWEQMLSTEGNSATYLQYSYARCCSILRRAEIKPTEELDLAAIQPKLLIHPAEQQLLKKLARLPSAIKEASERYAPFVIADWCYTTARDFGVFFEQCPVLKAETIPLRDARLALVSATAQALKNGLTLLGIKAPEQM